MLLSILGASLLANIFIGKGVIVMRNGRGIYRAGEWIVMVMKTKKVKNKKKEKIMKSKWIFNAPVPFN